VNDGWTVLADVDQAGPAAPAAQRDLGLAAVEPAVSQTAPLCSPRGMNGIATPKRSVRLPRYAELDDLYALVRHE
jgi:hypothetical protein